MKQYRKKDRGFEDRLTDVLPCKPGDKIFLVDVVDCKSGECADRGMSVCEHVKKDAPQERILACKENHPIIREVEVSQITASMFQSPKAEEYGAMIIINDEFVFVPETLNQITKTYEGAEALIKEQ